VPRIRSTIAAGAALLLLPLVAPTGSAAVRVQRGAPAIVCASPDGEWHRVNVALACTAADPQRLVRPGDASFVLRTTVAGGQETARARTGSRRVCDRTGDCATAGPIGGNRIDRRPPVVVLAQPAEGGRYGLLARHGVRFTCTDGGSGISSCQATAPVDTEVPTGPAALGPQHFTVIAQDRAGNRTKVRHRYRVDLVVPGSP
jgi:hypothetical protein